MNRTKENMTSATDEVDSKSRVQQWMQDKLWAIGSIRSNAAGEKEVDTRRRGARRLLGAAAAAAAIAFGGLTAAGEAAPDQEMAEYEVVVDEGDTVWDLAREVYGEGVDVREYIEDLDADIKPGETVTFRNVPQSRVLELLEQERQESEPGQ